MLMRVLPVAALGTLLAGCATDGQFATLSKGACEAFPRPQYQIKGKTSYDQKWSDEVTEAGVAGCKWQRPDRRPAELDAPKMPVKAPPAPPKKPTFLQRWRGIH